MNHTEAYKIVGHFKSSKLFLAAVDSVNVLLLSTAKSDASRTTSILFNIYEHVITCYQIPKTDSFPPVSIYCSEVVAPTK